MESTDTSDDVILYGNSGSEIKNIKNIISCSPMVFYTLRLKNSSTVKATVIYKMLNEFVCMYSIHSRKSFKLFRDENQHL